MSTTKLTLFSLITKEIVLKFLTFFFLVRNIQANIEQLYTKQKSDNIKDLREALEENLSKLLTNYNKNRTVVKSGGSRMSEDEAEDKGLKFDAGDRTDRTVNYIKGSPRARQQLNAKKVEEAYNTDTRHWIDVGLDWLTGINRKNSHWVSSDRDPQSVKAEQSRVESHNKMKTQMWDAAMMAMPDGIVSGNGSPMTVSASNVTPIQDGSVKLAKSDPRDSAIFAKTGGPFDKLFDDIFGKVNAIYDMSVRYGSSSTTNNRYGGDMVQSMLENHFANVFGSTSTTNNRYGGDMVQSMLENHFANVFGSTSTTNNRYGGDMVQSMLENHFANVFGSTSTTNNQYGGDIFASRIDPTTKAALNSIATNRKDDDTLATLYDGWTSPQAYSRRTQAMTNRIGRYDAKTGETSFNIRENMQMARIAEAQGRNTEDVRNEIIQRNRGIVEPAPERAKREPVYPNLNTPSINELARIASNGGFTPQSEQGFNQSLDVHIHGDINLKSPTGESIKIGSMIENDPMLIRKVTELIVSQIGNNTHGGRNELFRNRYSST